MTLGVTIRVRTVKEINQVLQNFRAPVIRPTLQLLAVLVQKIYNYF